MVTSVAVTAFRVAGLFHRLDHTIELNQEDRITIIHGPNGAGKTTVLRIFAYVFGRRLAALRQIPFDRIDITFDSGELLTIEQLTGPDSERRTRVRLQLSVRRPRRRSPEPFVLQIAKPGRDVPLAMIDEWVNTLTRQGPHEWWDQETQQLLDYDGVIELYGDQLPRAAQPEMPKWLTTLLGSVPIHIIETQRLSVPRRVPAGPRYTSRPIAEPFTAVNMLAQDLADRIRAALAAYAERSQGLDRTFPSRLLEEGQLPAEASQTNIRSRYEVQGQNRARLIAAGLLDAGEQIVLPRKRLNQTERRVLWNYLADVDQKLEVLYPIVDKIDLFREIINSKYVGKAIAVRREQGFAVVTDKGGALDPRFLSSGEQHELVLAYRLLFDVRPGSLILIDEPELSLHVAWQQMFLPDLQRISKTAQLDFLVATHSPIIIGNRWDLTVQLAIGD